MLKRFTSLLLLCVAVLSIVSCKPTAKSERYGTRLDMPVQIQLKGSDPDNDPLTYTITSLPEFGVLTGEAPLVTYTPNAGFSGADSFQYKVNDGEEDSALATIEIVVIEKAGKAILGPVVNADVEVFRLDDLNSVIYETRTTNSLDLELAGLIPLPDESLIDPESLYLVTVSGGEDIDADDDGVLDDNPTRVGGTLHGVFVGRHILSGTWNVSAVTDAMYYRVKTLLALQASDQSILNEINYRTQLLLSSDITGDDKIDIDDLITWHPITHRHVYRRSTAKLNELIRKIHYNTDAQQVAAELVKTKSEIAEITLTHRIHNVVVNGSEVLVATDNGVYRYDVTEEDVPVLRGLVRFPPNNFDYKNDIAFAYQENWVAVGPLSSVFQTIELTGQIRFARIVGDLLVIADQSGDLHIYQAAENGEYELLRTEDLDFYAYDVFGHNDTLYLLNRNRISSASISSITTDATLSFAHTSVSFTFQDYVHTVENTLYLKSSGTIYQVQYNNGEFDIEVDHQVNDDYLSITSDYVYGADDASSSINIYSKDSFELLGRSPAIVGLDGLTVVDDFMLEWGMGIDDRYYVLISDSRIPPVSEIIQTYDRRYDERTYDLVGNDDVVYSVGPTGIVRYDLTEDGSIASESKLSSSRFNSGIYHNGYLYASTGRSLITYQETANGVSEVRTSWFPQDETYLKELVGDLIIANSHYSGIINVDVSDPANPSQQVYSFDYYSVRNAYPFQNLFFVSSFDGLAAISLDDSNTPQELFHWQVSYSDHNGIDWSVPFGDYLLVKDAWDNPKFYILVFDSERGFSRVSSAELGKDYIRETQIVGNKLYANSLTTLYINEITDDGKILSLGELAMPVWAEGLHVNKKGIYTASQKGMSYIRFPSE